MTNINLYDSSSDIRDSNIAGSGLKSASLISQLSCPPARPPPPVPPPPASYSPSPPPPPPSRTSASGFKPAPPLKSGQSEVSFDKVGQIIFNSTSRGGCFYIILHKLSYKFNHFQCFRIPRPIGINSIYFRRRSNDYNRK